MSPEELVARLNEGRLAVDSGRYEVGWTICFSVAFSPEIRAQAFLCMGEARFGLRSYDEAIKLGLRALDEKAPPLKAVFLLLGKAYYKSNRIEQARKYWLKVLKLDPQNPEATSCLASITMGVPQCREPLPTK